MKRNSLFTKIAALMLCVMLVIGMPMSAFAWEGEMDVQENKAELVIGDNTLEVYTGMATTIYSWTAKAEGTLSITMPNYVGWSYELAKGGEVVAESSTTAEYPDAYPYVDVKAGDEVTLTVTTNGQTQPVTTSIYAEFSYKEGTEANPMIVYIPGGGTYTIAAGETMYFSCYQWSGQWSGYMTISSAAEFEAVMDGYIPVTNGVETEIMYNTFRGKEVSFYIKNTTDADAEYDVSFAVPVGTMDNPAELNVGTVDAKGENSAAGDYVYSYSVTEDGTIYIEMTSETWFYSIEKIDGLTLVSTATGETWSDDEGASATVSYEVVVGDMVKVVVMPYGGAETVDFNAWFEATPEEPDVTEPFVPVAVIGEVEYGSVADALNAAVSGDTVTMIADSDESDAALIIPAGATLNLGAYTLNAKYVIGLKGSFLTATHSNQGKQTAGKLVIDKNNVSLSSEAKSGSSMITVPVWIESEGAYKFGRTVLTESKVTLVTDKEAGTATFTFYPSMADDLKAEIVKNGNESAGITIVVTVSYVTADGIDVSCSYEYPASMILNAASKGSGLTCATADCNTRSELRFYASIISDTGAVIASVARDY